MTIAKHSTATPIHHISFHSHDIQSWKDERTETAYAVLRPIVEAIGLDWSAQLQRLKRDELYRDALSVVVTTTLRGEQEVVGLDIKMLPIFLATINRQRVKDQSRPTLLVFQKECAQALADYWQRGVAVNPRSTGGDLTTAWEILGQLVEAGRQNALALQAQEERQRLLETRQEAQEGEIAALKSRKPPEGKLRIEDWLRREAKPYLKNDLMQLLRDACNRRERPTLFRPEGMDYPLRYYMPNTIADAYEEVTRQLRFLIHDPAVAYKRQRRHGS